MNNSFFKQISFVLSVGIIGVPLGLGVYTFIYGQGYSYLVDSPETCANCHIMRDQLNSWRHSSHHHVATCNSCHNPKGKLPGLVAKAINGFNHSVAFTSGNFPDPIRIKPLNKKIVAEACKNCHEAVHEDLNLSQEELQENTCINCHQNVGHFRR